MSHVGGLGYGLKIRNGRYYIYYNYLGHPGEIEVDETYLKQVTKTYTLLDDDDVEYTEDRQELVIDDHASIQVLAKNAARD